MEELCPGHQRRRRRCSKSTFACPGPRYNLLIPPGLHEGKGEGRTLLQGACCDPAASSPRTTPPQPHPPATKSQTLTCVLALPLRMIKHKRGKNTREAARLPESETDERTIQGEGERFILAARRGVRRGVSVSPVMHG